MMYNQDNKLKYKKAVPINTIMLATFKFLGLCDGMNKQKIYKAWEEVSMASLETLFINYSSGTLFVRLNSSVLRSQLFLQRAELVARINSRLLKDPLFDKNNKKVGLVKTLILK